LHNHCFVVLLLEWSRYLPLCDNLPSNKLKGGRESVHPMHACASNPQNRVSVKLGGCAHNQKNRALWVLSSELLGKYGNLPLIN